MGIGQAYRNGIKSIQRGVMTFPGTGNEVSVSVSPVDPAKAELVFLGASNGVGGSIDSAVMCRLSLVGNNTVRANRVGTGASNAVAVSWQLVERY